MRVFKIGQHGQHHVAQRSLTISEGIAIENFRIAVRRSEAFPETADSVKAHRQLRSAESAAIVELAEERRRLDINGPSGFVVLVKPESEKVARPSEMSRTEFILRIRLRPFAVGLAAVKPKDCRRELSHLIGLQLKASKIDRIPFMKVLKAEEVRASQISLELPRRL